MISSTDEFRLLLNKWMSESRDVFIVILQNGSNDPRCMAVSIGELFDVDDDTLSIKGEKGNCAMVKYSDCELSFESAVKEWAASVLTISGRKFEDVFLLISPEGTYFAIGDATSRS